MKKEFIGTDVSKETLDFHIHGKMFHFRIDNSDNGLSQLTDIIKSQGLRLKSVWFVMEDTGYYSYRLMDYLSKNNITFTSVNALEIKRSMGIVRTKSDKADSATIARYAYQHRDSLQPSQVKKQLFLQLGNLFSLRDKLVSQRGAFQAQIKEFKHCLDLKDDDFQILILKDLMTSLNDKINSIETRLNALIKEEDALATNYKLITSVVGIGPVVATYLLITTENFTRFEDARKFACYCGVAPFEHTSGTSIKGRNKVSHLANKKMKSLLDLSAKSAIAHDPETREYFQRKEKEGKPQKAIRNAIRNKLIRRVFSVIKRQSVYVRNGYENIFLPNCLALSKS